MPSTVSCYTARHSIRKGNKDTVFMPLETFRDTIITFAQKNNRKKVVWSEDLYNASFKQHGFELREGENNVMYVHGIALRNNFFDGNFNPPPPNA